MEDIPLQVSIQLHESESQNERQRQKEKKIYSLRVQKYSRNASRVFALQKENYNRTRKSIQNFTHKLFVSALSTERMIIFYNLAIALLPAHAEALLRFSVY